MGKRPREHAVLLGSQPRCAIWQIGRLQAGASRRVGTRKQSSTHISQRMQHAKGLVQLSQLLVSFHLGHPRSLCAAQPINLE